MKKEYAYLFEAHSIQSYVMNGGKLAEMVGASELLETLIGKAGPLDAAMQQLKFAESDYAFTRRGGGAFYILFTEQEKAIALRDLWSLVAANFATGLQWIHVVAEGRSQKEAIQKGQEKLRQKRNQPTVSLPEINPLMRRNPRTGLPAIDARKDKGEDGKLIALDAETLSKLHERCQNSELLFNKFISNEHRSNTKDKWQFPRNLDHDEDGRKFPYKGDNHTIAIIHADGNGLGQILMDLGDALEDSKDYANIFRELSEKIDFSTQLAAQKALQEIIRNHYIDGNVLPIRPLILGGDDLTLIIRGDLALDYAKEFLELFEKETKKQLEMLAAHYPAIKKVLPKQMTACAGIAFIRSNQPFYLGYQLAESLCGHAKNSSRDTKQNRENNIIPSSLIFYHVTTSMIDQYAEVQKHELTVQIENEPHLLTLGAYGIGAFAEELPSFSELERLKQAFQNKAASRGPARHILTLMHANPSQAEHAYSRWQEMMGSKKDSKAVLQQFDEACDSLFANRTRKDNLPFAIFSNQEEKAPQYRTFLGDLTSWLAIEGEQQ